VKLPVSGLEIEFRLPTGSDDLALIEAGGNQIEQALVALARLAFGKAARAGRSLKETDWRSLSVTDIECALLGLRRFLEGDSVTCLLRNRSHECGESMEMSFSVTALLDDVSPRMPRGVTRVAGKARKFELTASASPVRFHVPTVSDQLAVLGKPEGGALLLDICTGRAKLSKNEATRIERAMEALAPAVSREIDGVCPNCGKAVRAILQVPRLVMEELTQTASGVFSEIDLLASEYHWAEAAIVALPQRRRKEYAEKIRERRGN
jgi:hypothetical protein